MREYNVPNLSRCLAGRSAAKYVQGQSVEHPSRLAERNHGS
jgi:hypothetical protein